MKKFIPVAVAIALLLTPLPALATGASCPAQPSDGGFIQESWKSKFPFDLVYPLNGNLDTDIDDISKCPQFIFWDTEFEMCSIPQIALIVKGIFVVKLTIGWLSDG